jgi:hypothetical protein
VPVDRAAAHALFGQLRSAPLFGDYRGQPPADTEALIDLIVCLSQFAADHADAIDAIDLNPVIVHARGNGVSVVDALILKHDRQAVAHRGAAG